MDYISVAYAFRKELDKLHGLGQLPEHLKKFPSSCCGAVSVLLGDYLKKQFGLPAEYVQAIMDGKPHGWVELDGVVIDITSDQFEGRSSVFIAAKDSWYDSWEEEVRREAVHYIEEQVDVEEHTVLRAVLSGAKLPDPYSKKKE
ncbi:MULTISPECIES: hypothetical protein [Pseudomonas aeruginosa group]|uniref:hypothetical protein n=1 Tax=Pseudomonas aeruginosa group TaxID=136841 RepID=UPI001A30B66F|nr:MULTISPECIES: hypothetical protein [Pseudomonas aeruginosa group]MBG6886106.1 hypothetical protein [Pseudomonas aeruginosa]MCY0315471.1 hypothetical protein [Pseudomonas aeruginosa]MCY0517508.1 hypothetical protein [Pseudomonas aeruginosa]MDI3610647.1 hypothetical protein [Pseudomonas aeruginosa]MDI3677570.1 hypothetical protein [Pseudomonas aeruginosa]